MLQLPKALSVATRPWVVVTLCLVAAGSLAAVFLFDVPTNRLLLVLMVLVCPLSHLLMGHGGHGHTEHGHATEAPHHHPATPATPATRSSEMQAPQ